MDLDDFENQIKNIKRRVVALFNSSELIKKLGEATQKGDSSIVTQVDIEISEIVKEEFSEFELCFYSEEEFDELSYPAIVVDPIDGTRELERGLQECAVSIALLNSQNFNDNYGWIYNPYTQFEISNWQSFIAPKKNRDQKLLGLVSNSEWIRGKYNYVTSSEIALAPRGSIAFKLGLLGAGACDFVITLRPKNIWDIAAGNIILNDRNFVCFMNGKVVDEFNETRLDGPILWCHPENLDMLRSIFQI